MAPPTRSQVWLTRYAALTALATLGLIGLGGLVTSHGAGMAVPDWPTSYGYNMFLFPVSKWVGGVFYEHTHRLYASLVGLLTLVLAIWLQRKSTDRRLAQWGWVALGLVVAQGVLGGLRVSLMKDQLGIFHAALGQAFLVLLTLIALVSSTTWRRWFVTAPLGDRRAHRWLAVTTAVIFAQLVLGATMRHQHAGLAVPDFPLAYGKLWPPTNDAFLGRVNALRTDVRDFRPVTAFQIQLHMAHRIVAVAVAVLVVVAALQLRRAFGRTSGAWRLGQVWMGLVALQVALGAITVWTNKAADIATAHVVIGACCLAIGAVEVALCRAALGRRSAAARALSVASPGLLAAVKAS